MRGRGMHRFTAALATATFATALAVAGPAHAGLGDPGPGGPIRFDLSFSGAKCNYLTGQVVVTMTISQDPAYSSWQYVGAYYEVHQSKIYDWNQYNVSNDTFVNGGWIGPGSAPLTVSFSIAPPTSNQWLEVDNIDVYPSDGWYSDMSVVTPPSCLLILPFPFPFATVKA
jgi:hypothetical protein